MLKVSYYVIMKGIRKMEKLKDLKDLRFTITDDMRQTMIDMLVIKQILDENKLTKKERKLFEKEKAKLLRHWQIEFQARNQTQVAIYRAYMSMSDEQKNKSDKH